MKNNFSLGLLFLILLTRNTLVYSQDCKPAIVSQDGKTEYFGGKIRDLIGLISDDKSSYSFYVVQVEKGKKANVAYVSFYESVKSRDDYNRAVTDYLTNEKLKTSYLEIELGNMIIKIPATSCILEPKTTMGDIYGYTVSFEGPIIKDQVVLLQNNDMKKFKIVLGGKPYERSFSKPTKVTQTIKASMNCVNLDNLFEVQKKKSEELNLTEVGQDDYSSTIIGKWLSQTTNGVTLEFIGDKIVVAQTGKEISNGTFKVSGNRLIYTGTTANGGSNNGVSEFKLFLKDMIILKEKDKEYTYERLK